MIIFPHLAPGIYKIIFSTSTIANHFPWENVFFFGGGVTSSESLETEFPPASGIRALKGMQSPASSWDFRRILEDGLLPG